MTYGLSNALVAQLARDRPSLVATPFSLSVAWDPAPGASKAIVDAAWTTLEPPELQELPRQVAEVPFSQLQDSLWELAPPGGLRLTQLGLDLSVAYDFDFFGVHIHWVWTCGDEDALRSNGWHLLISTWDPHTSDFAPTWAVPSLPVRGAYPAALVGASFANSTLKLPAVPSGKLRLALVGGDDPASFAPVPAAAGVPTLNQLTMSAVPYATNLTLADAGGARLWFRPGELVPGTPPIYVDFKASLQSSLTQKLKAKQPLSTSFALSSQAPAQVMLLSSVTGALERTFSGVTRTVLEGDPLPPQPKLLPGDPPLVIDQRLQVTADLTVRYDGLRLLGISDPLPAPSDVHGVIVGTEWVASPLPPHALDGQTVARVGVIGRASEPCELSVRFVRALSGEPLGDPTVVQLDPAAAIRTVWLVMKGSTPGEPAALAARATKGRFFWAAAGERPRVRIAVADAAPTQRTLTLGGVALPGETAHLAAFDLTAHFNSASPLFASDLFYTVDLSDLTFRYLR
jgi:hypothetical protein